MLNVSSEYMACEICMLGVASKYVACEPSIDLHRCHGKPAGLPFQCVQERFAQWPIQHKMACPSCMLIAKGLRGQTGPGPQRSSDQKKASAQDDRSDFPCDFSEVLDLLQDFECRAL